MSVEKRCVIVLLVAIFLSLSAYAEEYENFVNTDYIKLNFNVSSKLSISSQLSTHIIEDIDIELFFSPKNTRIQTLNSIETYPSAEVSSESIKYHWDSPKIMDIDYGFVSEVSIYNRPVKVREKVPYPIKEKFDDDFSDRLYNVIDLANNLDMKIDESKDNNFDYPELDSYLSAYEARGLNKKIADQIREESPMNVYDISYRLTELCQDEKLSDTSRARIEYIAGELILCYDKIKKNVIERPLSFAPRKKQSYNTGKLNYVSMN